MTMSLVEMDEVRKQYGEDEVLKGVSLSVDSHEVVCLIGASGSGKSTLLRCINGLETIEGGEIRFEGDVISGPGVNYVELRRHIGLVFQSFNLFPHMSVMRNVTIAPIKIGGCTKAEAEARARTLLSRVGLEEKADAYPDQLSGGQQQRVAIARAMAMEPKVLLLDEITSALDPELVNEVLRLVRDLRRARDDDDHRDPRDGLRARRGQHRLLPARRADPRAGRSGADLRIATRGAHPVVPPQRAGSRKALTRAAGKLIRPVFALAWVYAVLTTLAWAALLPVLPLFVRGPLEGSDVAVGFVMSGALLVAAVAQPTVGRLADRRGRRLLLIGGPLLFGSAVAGFSLVHSPEGLLLFRSLAAIGDAAFFVGAITVINDLAPAGRRGEAYNIYSLASWAGIGLGPLIGDSVLRAYSFNAVWGVCAALSLAGTAVALFLPDTRHVRVPPRTKFSIFSRATATPGSVLALEQVGFAALFVFTPLYARELGMRGAGLVLLVNAAVLISIRIFGRRLPDRLGAHRSATSGVTLVAIGLTLPVLFQRPAGLYAGAAFFGTGHALLYPALFMLGVGSVPEYESSAAVGSLKACEALGFAVGASLLGIVASLTSYVAVFAVAAAITLSGLIPLLWRRANPSGPHVRDSSPAAGLSV